MSKPRKYIDIKKICTSNVGTLVRCTLVYTMVIGSNRYCTKLMIRIEEVPEIVLECSYSEAFTNGLSLYHSTMYLNKELKKMFYHHHHQHHVNTALQQKQRKIANAYRNNVATTNGGRIYHSMMSMSRNLLRMESVFQQYRFIEGYIRDNYELFASIINDKFTECVWSYLIVEQSKIFSKFLNG